MIKATNEIQCYEINGEDAPMVDVPRLIIESHWNSPDRVVIKLPDGGSFTVLVRDIEAAIRNASNSSRY